MAANQELIKAFFKSYPWQTKNQTCSIDYDFFKQSIPKIKISKSEHAISAPNLNVFTGFDLGENEIKHCSVLTWFINPRANHSQGSLFFKILLEKFNVPNMNKYINEGYFMVTKEDSSADQGRVDIAISSDKFWYIIEAKISAGEQDEQIRRYNNILLQKAKAFNIPKDRCKIFFLTKDGRIPNTGHADYCISWTDIADVLINFSLQCKNEYVSATAKQYAKYIYGNI